MNECRGCKQEKLDHERETEKNEWFRTINFSLYFRNDEFKFGCTSLKVSPDLLYQLRHDITISPSGIAFVKVLNFFLAQ